MNAEDGQETLGSLLGDPGLLEPTDDDVTEAMRRIPGYLDISTEDFRTLYHQAQIQALERLFQRVRAGNLMRTGLTPLTPDLPLDQAARLLVRQGYKGLPVVDPRGLVLGMLTETDFLRRLGADSFLELLLRLVEDGGALSHRCHATLVGEAMTAPAVCVGEDTRLDTLLRVFRGHTGRALAVVDAEDRLCGLLLRKDLIHACGIEDLP